MANGYTTIDMVADQLRQNVRVNVGNEEPSATNQVDISFAGIDMIRLRVEGELSHQFGRFYSVPLKLTDANTINLVEKIATELTAYNCWLVIHPMMTRENLPASVLEWKKNADATMEKIVPSGRSMAETGRDIILAGETLLSASGTAGGAAIALSRFTPFGGSES